MLRCQIVLITTETGPSVDDSRSRGRTEDFSAPFEPIIHFSASVKMHTFLNESLERDKKKFCSKSVLVFFVINNNVV